VAKATYTPRERRLVADYASLFWAGRRVIFNPRLGPVPLESVRALTPNVPAKALSGYRRYPDALVDLGASVLMVEAKLIASGAAIGMLEEYLMLWASTNDYGDLHGKPITGCILTAFVDPIARQLADSHGFMWLVYAPSWIMTDLMSAEFNLSPPFVAGLSSTLQSGGSSSGTP
jgi:hypothetical protein